MILFLYTFFIFWHTKTEVKKMDEKKYNTIADRHKPKGHLLKNCFFAFIFGGSIAVIGQFLLEFYMFWFDIGQQEATPWMIITIVVVTCLLTGLGLFDKIANIAGAGTFIPITGFANSMSSAALEGKSEGFIQGIGSNIFKYGGCVITYGIVSSFIFGIIRYVFKI